LATVAYDFNCAFLITCRVEVFLFVALFNLTKFAFGLWKAITSVPKRFIWSACAFNTFMLKARILHSNVTVSAREAFVARALVIEQLIYTNAIFTRTLSAIVHSLVAKLSSEA
jgi:hypothetical protein